MTVRPEPYVVPLERAHHHARRWLADVGERPIPPRRDIETLADRVGGELPAGPVPPGEVVDLLAEAVEPGLMAMGSGRFYGWVIGGTLPAALAADWMVSAWDQNSGLRFATPGVVAAEEAAARWLLELLGLPGGADVGFVTGGTMANFTCLAAARQQVLTDAGWDLDDRGLIGAPPVRVFVGADRHATVDLTLRYLGLGAPIAVPADDQGRIRVDALASLLATGSGPTIVVLQAGNLHSGAFDDIAAATEVAHEYGAWVHVDGAFGLFAAASPALSGLLAGYEVADSWGTDAHKTLNVPYDCGIAIVAHPAALRSSMGVHTSYLIHDPGPGDPLDRVPELSRRARGVSVWAALRSLGRSGVADLVEGFARNASAISAGIAEIPGAEILHDVVFSQVSVSFGSDERTRAVTQRLLSDGVAWMSGSRWRDRDVMRVSVCNWSTDDDDVRRSIEAVRAAASAV